MKLLLNERNEIVAIGTDIEYGAWGNVGDLESWRINGTTYVMGTTYRAVEVNLEDIPGYVTEGCQYIYDETTGTFTLKDDCPNEYKDRIALVEDLLITSDEAVVSLYEMQMSQEEINIAQDEAIIGLYELMGGE